jgi:hypothetical protein
MSFKKATKEQAYVTIAIEGPSGSGKTYSAEELAKHLCPAGKRIYHIDSEKGSASKYAHIFDFLVDDDFGPTGKVNYHPDVWIKKMMAAVAQGDCGVLILDTPTHAWKGEGGVLSVIETIKKNTEARGKKADGFNAWQEGDKIYRRFMDTLLSLPCHRIFTLRSKQKYEKKQNEKGFMEVQKMGLEPEFRDGYEFEVDIQLSMDQAHTAVPLKHRLGPVLEGKVFPNPGEELAEIIKEWATTGEARPSQRPAAVQVAAESAVTVASPEPPVEDNGPNTDRMPDSGNPAAEHALFESLKSAMEKSETLDALNESGKKASAAKKSGAINAAQYKELSDLFTKRSKAIKAAKAA